MANPVVLGNLTGNDDNPRYMGSVDGAIPGGGGGGGQADTTGTFIESGCMVAWSGTGLVFDISAGDYWILGNEYHFSGGSVTLATGDSNNPRVDTIALTTSQTAVVIQGTAAVDPSKPSVDPVTQIELTHVDVAKLATTPGTTISNITIYAENAGSPTEWAGTTSGSGFTLNSTAAPHAGTTHITGTNVANNAYVQFQYASTVDLSQYERLVYYIQVTSNWNNNRWLRIGWFQGGVQRGNWVDVINGTYGFNTAAGSYLVIIIPTLAFQVPTGQLVNQIRFMDTGGAINFRLDDVSLQLASTGVQPVQGITQAQADARYQRLPSFDTLHFTAGIPRL